MPLGWRKGTIALAHQLRSHPKKSSFHLDVSSSTKSRTWHGVALHILMSKFNVFKRNLKPGSSHSHNRDVIDGAHDAAFSSFHGSAFV